MLCQKLKKQLSLIGWKNIIAGITIVSAFGTVGYYCYSKQKNKRLEQQSFIENQEQSISASLLFENSKFMNDNNILSDMERKQNQDLLDELQPELENLSDEQMNQLIALNEKLTEIAKNNDIQIQDQLKLVASQYKLLVKESNEEIFLLEEITECSNTLEVIKEDVEEILMMKTHINDFRIEKKFKSAQEEVIFLIKKIESLSQTTDNQVFQSIIEADMNTKEADQNSMQGISANESTTKENNYISSNEQPSTNENGNSTPEINHPNVQIEDSIQFTIPENIEFDRVYTIKVISKRYKDEKEESTTLNFKVVEYDYDAVKCVIFYQSGQRE